MIYAHEYNPRYLNFNIYFFSRQIDLIICYENYIRNFCICKIKQFLIVFFK